MHQLDSVNHFDVWLLHYTARVNFLWRCFLGFSPLLKFFVQLRILHFCPVGWGRRINQQLLYRRVRQPTQWVSWYDTKQSDDKVPLLLEIFWMQSTPSLQSLPGPLWPEMVVSDRVLSMCQTELNCVLRLNWITWNKTVFEIETVIILNWFFKI